MKRFFSFIIKQSVAIVLIVLFVLGFGIYSTTSMSINLLPDLNIPMLCVQVIYPGANAASVEADVTEKLEEGLGSVSGITEVESYSYDNLSAVVLSFDYGTDTAEKKSDIQSKLLTLNLPDGVTTSITDIDLNASALAVLSLTAEEGLDAAYARAKELSSKLSAIDGVENVEIKGGAEYSYTVKPYGGAELICPLIVQAFSYGALDLPLGNINDNGADVQIRNNSDIKSVDDIKDMPIELPEELVSLMRGIRAEMENAVGAEITPSLAQTIIGNEALMEMIRGGFAEYGLGASNEFIAFILTHTFPVQGKMVVKTADIATVELTASYSSYAYYSGGKVKLTSGIIIEVYKSNGANSSDVVRQVKKVYGAEGYTADISLLDDQSEFISDSISNVLISMLIGGALAIVIIFLFLKKVRLSIVIAITMPLSVLASLICLYLLGITLNMVSLGGLAVGIGMLVDNSIVVIECISKHRDRGKTAFEAAVDGTTEVGGALFGSTLTTVCVFIPIIFAGGLTAEIFTDLAFAVIFSLAFSLIVALTVIPALYALFDGKRLLKGGKPCGEPLEPKPQRPVIQKLQKLKQPVIMDKVAAGYGKILPKVLSKKLITILTAVAVFGASIGLLFVTGTEFLPSIDKGQIEVTMSYGSGRELETVQRDVLEFSEVLAENIENIDYLSASVGKNGLLALTNSGIITIQLKTNRHTDRVVNSIRALAESHPTVGSVSVREIDGVVASLMSGSDNLSVTVVGSDGDTLIEIAEKIKAKLADRSFTDIKDSATDKSKQYTLDFDRALLAEKGLDYQTVIMTLRIGIASHTACTVTIGGEDYNLNVCFADTAVTDKQSLENFVIGFYGGAPVKLKDVLKGGAVIEEYTEACIRRLNGSNMITVSATLPNEDTGSAGKKMQAAAKEVLKEYEGYSFTADGISSYLDDAFEGLAVALVISFFLLYAVMAIQFASFVKPLIIMASIPFSFTGGFIALVITGTSLNVVSFIGLIMLMGVVVNNAIVMLEKIKQLHDEGMPHFTAVTEACRTRLRPILMTTLTTILALIPMAIGVGQGSELMQPLGIAVIGGLLIGTLVTLVLVPAVYCAVHRLKPEKE